MSSLSGKVDRHEAALEVVGNHNVRNV